MTIEQFYKLSTRPAMKCRWGGKEYMLSSLDHKSKTCYIRKIGVKNMKPYPVSFESIELLSHVPRKRNKLNKTKSKDDVSLRT